ncbi:hypothetical protein ACFQVC_22365 [Streptomyces monticola]|uniref:Low molecular weight antigen MTB12-like C-terminal domain-containing protein n=1 Tax=Streptomyces monticola TaxID=2666263 RepID=A0ABW2JNJ7_9ACTN
MVLGSGGNRRGRTRIAAWAAAAVLVTGAAATGCGDDSGGGDGTPPPRPTAEKTASAPADPSPSSPRDAGAAEKEIKENWEKFFDPRVEMKDKEALLENGTEMRAVLKSFSGDERGEQVTAKVSKVEFTSADEADVTYSLSLKEATVMPSASGVAVEQDGDWKVSVKTLCSLVQLSGNESPGPGC